jgi:hypothetical protein
MLKSFYLLLLFTLVILSCSEESNPAFDTENFTTIFDNNKFDIGYSPIDMVQTPDGGYLVLGSRKLSDSNFSGIYLLKADKNGNFISELEVDDTYVNPVGKFIQIGDLYYFFSMEYPSLQANITAVDVSLENVTFTPVLGINGVNPTYPSVSAFIDNSFLLQCYDHANRQTGLFVVPVSGATSAGRGFTIGVGASDNVDESIINSFLNAGRKFPYEVGKVGGVYFLNGFFDFNFSLVFTDLNPDNDPSGVVFGQQPDFNGGFSSVVSLSGSKFAASTFYFGENYIMPNASITILGFSSMTPDQLPGLSFPELVTNAKVKVLRSSINTKNVLLYGSDTKTKQIGLYFYDEATGEFLGSRYLGFSNPFEIANVINTVDGGIAVCGTTYVAGRFARICIFKLSKEKISENVK